MAALMAKVAHPVMHLEEELRMADAAVEGERRLERRTGGLHSCRAQFELAQVAQRASLGRHVARLPRRCERLLDMDAAFRAVARHVQRISEHAMRARTQARGKARHL